MGDENPPDQAAAEIVHKVEPLIVNLPPEKQAEVRRIISTSIQYQGPLPPPEMLAEYGRIIPNGADRLLTLLERQTLHRIDMESLLVRERVSVTKRGQWIAAGLSIFFGLIAYFLGDNGHDWLAGVISVTTIVGLAVVFVLGKEPGQSSAPKEGNELARPPAKQQSRSRTKAPK